VEKAAGGVHDAEKSQGVRWAESFAQFDMSNIVK
jgi:hypothetical protein